MEEAMGEAVEEPIDVTVLSGRAQKKWVLPPPLPRTHTSYLYPHPRTPTAPLRLPQSC